MNASGMIDPTKVSQVQACTLLCVKRDHLLEWEAAGCPRNKNRTYNLALVSRWRMENQRGVERQRAGANATNGSYADMAEKFRALKAQQEYEEKAGRLMPKTEAEQKHLAVVLTVRAALLSMPDQLAAQVENLPARDASRIIRQRMLALCEEFRAGFAPIDDALAKAIDELVVQHAPPAVTIPATREPDA